MLLVSQSVILQCVWSSVSSQRLSTIGPNHFKSLCFSWSLQDLLLDPYQFCKWFMFELVSVSKHSPHSQVMQISFNNLITIVNKI